MTNHEYYHEAMATTFTLNFSNCEEEHAKWLAGLCVQRIDELELMWSRFVADSDISRINKLKSGENVYIEHETKKILAESIIIAEKTGGYFDIGTAEFSNIFRGYKEGILTEYEYGNALQTAMVEKAKAAMYVVPDQLVVHCVESGIQLDLGGIGKGYALDLLSDIIKENDCNDFSLKSADSTILTGSQPGNNQWKYKLSARLEEIDITLHNNSVSASGNSVQGNHIFNPLTGLNETAKFERIWVCCHNAMHSDAYATACYNMEIEDIKDVMKSNNHIIWVAYSTKGIITYLENNN